MLFRLLVVTVGSCLFAMTGAFASERVRLGYGILVTNDIIGDGSDRWQTGSVASSRIWGPEWAGAPPEKFGQLLEFRFNAQTVSPENIVTPAAGDRPFAGVLTLGVHSHFRAGGMDVSLGGDLAFTGPQTGLDDFQLFLHDLVGHNNLSPAVRNAQIGDEVHPGAVFEAGRKFDLGGTARVRPFVESRVGLETMVRIGADFQVGSIGRDELYVRAPVTGHRYRAVKNGPTGGMIFIAGGDFAYVSDSDLLPESRGLSLTDHRSRLRAGLHWEGEKGHSAFYGVTWLSEEFDGQRESQIVGSLRIGLNF
ncbi:lipid A deacylase LpxR family protein [Roseovarius sp. TE539]|uniref:lipid A deacylase LpxR family protein n=1 Tax=Roseovarius sp. TE539 TaxID=2249812 RepID=UPI00215C426B|nr:lipid A deacylase LpxR family protein [Roseovarius sp. TE539]